MKTHYYRDDIMKICDKNHLTVEEIFEKLSKIYDDAWKSTVYRNVEEMVKSWDLKKVVWVWKKAYFETNIWNHIHLIDINTWFIMDLQDEVMIPNLPKNFKMTDLDIKLFGEFSS